LEKRIITCEIRKHGLTNAIFVNYDNGSFEELYCYYPDELSFRRCEFVGLTRQQARDLIRNRDIAYLRN
jgi:hypothetical protein